jgi:hypothetical protein
LSLSALTVALAVLGLAQQKAADLPTLDQILAKSIEAAGGQAAQEKIVSTQLKGALEVVTYGLSGPIELCTKAPNKLYMHTELANYGEVLQGFDGQTGWVKTPDSGLREMSGAELVRMKRNADVHRYLHLKDQFAKMTVTGKGKAGAVDAYIVEAQPAEGDAEKFFFDAQTGLLVRAEYMDPQNGLVAVSMEDFKTVDGVLAAQTIRQEGSSLSLLMKFTEVRHNLDIDDAKFAKPAN